MPSEKARKEALEKLAKLWTTGIAKLANDLREFQDLQDKEKTDGLSNPKP